jgi:hypothetical protein
VDQESESGILSLVSSILEKDKSVRDVVLSVRGIENCLSAVLQKEYRISRSRQGNEYEARL